VNKFDIKIALFAGHRRRLMVSYVDPIETKKPGFRNSLKKWEIIQRDVSVTTNAPKEKFPTRKILTKYARSYKQTYNIERFHF
jgi:hypothetical protein